LTWRQNDWQLPDDEQDNLTQWQQLVPLIEAYPDLQVTYHPVDDPTMTTATTTLTAVMTKL
jgi:ribonuclease HI